MKKIIIAFTTLLLVAVMSVSCNNNSPKDVATTWLTSFYHIDYETAKKVSTEETKTLLSSLQQFTNMLPDSNKKDMKKIVVNVKSVKEDGDKAVATYTTSDSPGKDQTLPLVKQNGKWLVQFSKNDQMDGSGPAENGAGADQPAGSDSSGAAAGADTTMH